MLTMEDMLAIVKPHNDKLIAEGRAAEMAAQVERLQVALVSTTRELENLFAMVQGEAPSLLEDHFSYMDIVAAIEKANNLLNDIKSTRG